MRKIATLKVEYTYVESPDSEARLDRFYNWLINKAIDNLIQKGIDNNSTQKYIKNNGQSRDISNSRGSSQNTQSQKDHNLQNVQGRQVTSGKVWQSLANKQQKIIRDFGGAN